MSNQQTVDTQPVLRLEDLTVEFQVGKRTATVLEHISFDVNAGETLCLVGESGCGKSMTALAIMGLVPDLGRCSGGEIILNGKNLLDLDEKAMRKIRGNSISMIFQEPMTALNPVYTVGEQLYEPLRLHQKLNNQQARERRSEMLRAVEIPAPERRIRERSEERRVGKEWRSR